jgi:glyoxalase superfamily protein
MNAPGFRGSCRRSHAFWNSFAVGQVQTSPSWRRPTRLRAPGAALFERHEGPAVMRDPDGHEFCVQD